MRIAGGNAVVTSSHMALESIESTQFDIIRLTRDRRHDLQREMYALNGLHQDSGHGCGRWSSKRFASTHLQSIITLYPRHTGCSVK